MPARPSLTVVTRLSRSAEFLERVLQGLLLQSDATLFWSIVIQKPLSDDHKTVLRKADTNGIKVTISKAKPGISLGELANIGVQAIRSDYVLLHDDDDALIGDFTGPTVRCLTQTAHIAVACHAAFIQESGARQRLNFILSPGEAHVDQADLSSDNVIAVNALIYRRSAFDAVGGYPQDVDVAEDWLFNIKLVKSGKIAILPRVCTAVYLRDSDAGLKQADHTDRDLHKEMRSRIRAAESAGDSPDLEQRLNTPGLKIRRQVDRLVFRTTQKFLKR